MTSGVYETFPTSAIWVNREKRQRRELRDIESLALSISEVGLIHAPVIRRDGELIVGERRLTAVRSLGWTDIQVQFIEDLSEIELKKVELEENTRRVDITWQEQAAAVAEYHALRSSEPEWTQKKTSEALGYSANFLSQLLDVAKELDEGNKLVTEAPKLSTAVNITARKKERHKAAVIQSIPTIAAKKDEVAPPAPIVPLLNADFIEWLQTYTGPKFNLLHCDFPYGVGMHKSDQGAGKEFGTYADGEDVYWKLLDALALAMKVCIHDQAHLMFWFSMDYYQRTKERLEEMGWDVNPFPLVWLKSDNTGIIPDANRGPRRIYETAFLASRGDRKIVSAVSNAFAYPGREKEIHMNEKPLPMLKHFLRMLTDETTSFLDPTAGSANAVRAAQGLGAHRVLGIERDPEFFSLASAAYFKGDIDV